MMSQVVNVEAEDIKDAVNKALALDRLEPDSGNDFDGAGETEVQCVDRNGVTVWDSSDGDESALFS
jgi:hypothetical protein